MNSSAKKYNSSRNKKDIFKSKSLTSTDIWHESIDF